MYKRICIIGGPGTGKTTLADKLSNMYNIPATHIDALNYMENWVERDDDERDQMVLSIVNKDEWIIDGVYKSTLMPRLERADLVIWLDYSTFSQTKGILKRYFTYKGKAREDIPGCNEKMDKSFFFYTVNFRKNKRKDITESIAHIDSSKVLRFTKRSQLNKWVSEISKENSGEE